MDTQIGDLKKKTFWQKPEGVTGMLMMAGLIVGGGYLLYHFLPFIITLLQNAIHASLLLIGLAVILYVVLDPKFRNMIWYLYKIGMKKMTGWIVEIDPISIIKVYIDELRERRREVNGQITKLKGEIGKIARVIEDNVREIKKQMSFAQAAKNQGKKPQVALAAREAARLKDSNSKLGPLKIRMDKLYKYLDKIYSHSGYLIQDMASEVRVKEQEYNAIKASHSAMKTALSIFNGDDDKKLMFDQAMEFVQEDMGRKLGEMERFMDMSETFIDNIDVQNGVYEEEGLDMLDSWNDNDFSFLLADPMKGETVVIPSRETPQNEPIKMKEDSAYGEFFNN